MAKTLNIYSKINDLRERYYAAARGKELLIKLLGEAADRPQRIHFRPVSH